MLATSSQKHRQSAIVSRQAVYRFGPFRLDGSNRLLSSDGREINLPPRSFDVLLMLVHRHGQLVTKSEMMDALWAQSFVEESNLTVAISALRRALGEDRNHRKYIQTVSGHGYRFIGEVAFEESVTPEEPARELAASSNSANEPRAAQAATGLSTEPAPMATTVKGVEWRLIVASMLLFASLVGGFLVWRAFQPRPRLHSIAILPATGPGVDNYVRLGLTDTLISRVEGTIEVRPMSSVLMYLAAPTDPSTVGHEQNADGIVTSSLTQNGDETRLQIDLVRAADAKTLWSKSFTDPRGNISRLQIAAGDALDAELARVTDHAGAGMMKGQAKSPVNDQAYQLYLKGRYCWNRRTEEGLRQSIDYFRQSIAVDPNYARAYAGLADSYALLASFSVESGRTAIPDARAAALSAIQLDPTLAEPHASLGMIYFFTDWNGPAAEQEFQRSIALNPNYATAHHWYALDLAAMGRFPQALYEIHRAQALDPLSLIIDTNVGWIEFLSHDYTGALADYKKVLDLDPSFVRALTRRGIAEIRIGKASAAASDLTLAARLSNDPYILGLLGQAQAASGDRSAAERTLKQLQAMAESKYVPPFALGLVYLGLERRDAAINAFGKAVDDRSTSMVYAKIDPSLDGLRGDPHFQTVIASMHF